MPFGLGRYASFVALVAVMIGVLQVVAPASAAAQTCTTPIQAPSTAQQSILEVSDDGCYAAQIDHTATGSGTTLTTQTTFTNPGLISANITSVLFTGGTSNSDCTYAFSPGGQTFRFVTIDGFARRANFNTNVGASIVVTCTVQGCGVVDSEVGVETRPLGRAANDPLPAGFVPPSLSVSVALDDCPTSPNRADSADGLNRLVGLTKSSSVGSAPIGSALTWTVGAENLGPTHLTGVKISDVLPPGLAVVEPLPVGLTYDAATHTVSAKISELGVGARASFRFDTTVQALSEITSTSTVTTDQGASNAATATVIGLPAPAGQAAPAPASVPAAIAVNTPGLAVTGAETDVAADLALALIASGALALALSLRVRRE